MRSLKQQKELQRSRMHRMPAHAGYARASPSMLRHTTAFPRLEASFSTFSSHLDLNDGEFSASMNHQPAVLGVVAMGSAALPKLTVALKENQNRDIRLAAALCLNQIDGATVLPTMKEALRSEPDACVRRFLEISVKLLELEEEGQSGRSTEQETAASELRRGLLTAMRCGN